MKFMKKMILILIAMPIELINFLKSQENGGNKQQIKKNKGVPLKVFKKIKE